MDAAAEQVCNYYRGLWFARSDLYSHWTPEGWRPVREPVSTEAIYAGLTKTGPSLSGYFPNVDNTSHVGALDLDRDDGLDLAYRIAQTLAGAGATAYVERSRRGAHLWLVADALLPAKVWRRGLAVAIEAAGIAPDPKIEVRPEGDLPDAEGFGKALRLPMMPHPVAGTAWPLKTATGEPLGTSIREVLLAVEETRGEVIIELAEQWQPPLDPRALDRAYRTPRVRGSEGESITAILADLWGVVGITPGGKAFKCPAHDDHNPSCHVLPDDRRVICFNPACEFNNDGRGLGSYQLRKAAAARQAAAV